MRLFVLCRHAHTVLNLEQRVNGDPSVSVPLTPDGEREAAMLGDQLRNVPLDACVHTRFDRTRRTAELALRGREVPLHVEPLFGDIDVGELDGGSIADYRAWKREHARGDPFPGGESLDEAAHRYAQAYRNLLAAPWPIVLVVCHEIPVRYAVNAASGSDGLDGPIHVIGNARPYLFDEGALARAAAGIERLADLGVVG